MSTINLSQFIVMHGSDDVVQRAVVPVISLYFKSALTNVAMNLIFNESEFMKFLLIVFPAVLLMAACSSGSSNDDGNVLDEEIVLDDRAFTTSDEAIDALIELGDLQAELDVTPVDNVPTSGSATYDGVFSISQVVERFPGDTDPDLVGALVGELELDVNFGNNTLSGSADNFFNATTAVDGNITISEGEIFRDDTGVLFDAEVGGELPFDGEQRSIDAVALGIFNGDDAEVAAAFVTGTADGGIDLFGVFVAED